MFPWGYCFISSLDIVERIGSRTPLFSQVLLYIMVFRDLQMPFPVTSDLYRERCFVFMILVRDSSAMEVCCIGLHALCRERNKKKKKDCEKDCKKDWRKGCRKIVEKIVKKFVTKKKKKRRK